MTKNTIVFLHQAAFRIGLICPIGIGWTGNAMVKLLLNSTIGKKCEGNKNVQSKCK